MSRNATRQMVKSPQNVIEAKKELQERWKQLELKPATLLHLQEVMDTSGVDAANSVTEALLRQKKQKSSLADTGKAWGSETLRLLSLQGVRPHLIDVLHIMLGTLLAWHFITFPSLTDEMLNNAGEIALAVLFLVMSLIGICLSCRFRRNRPAFQQQQKPS